MGTHRLVSPLKMWARMVGGSNIASWEVVSVHCTWAGVPNGWSSGRISAHAIVRPPDTVATEGSKNAVEGTSRTLTSVPGGTDPGANVTVTAPVEAEHPSGPHVVPGLADTYVASMSASDGGVFLSVATSVGVSWPSTRKRSARDWFTAAVNAASNFAAVDSAFLPRWSFAFASWV